MLRHPGIVPLLAYEADAKLAYVVMPLLTGESLRSRLQRDSRMRPAEVMRMLAEAALAVQAVHDFGCVHRGLRPSRLFLASNRLLLTDFGQGRLIWRDDLDASYMAPELAKGETPSPAADIYSLGCVAYEALAGRPPFVGDSPLAVAVAHVRDEPPPLPETVAPPVRRVVIGALAKQPADRWPTAAALAEVCRSAGSFVDADEAG
jgi:serine/threonine-protein kinase